MYAGLKRSNRRNGWAANYLETDDECVHRLYVEAMGHEPPAARNAAMSTQFEYGNRSCRTKVMRAAILSACSNRELVAA